MSKILIFAYWRTGSNLLTSIFTQRGYFDFNEFYSLTGIHQMMKFRNEGQSNNLLEHSNSYLVNLINQTSGCTLKINYPHIEAMNKQVFDRFSHRILLWRSDFYAMSVSKVVAEHRRHWQTTDPEFIQPEFRSEIDPIKFEKSLLSDMASIQKYIDNQYNPNDVDFVVNYERDLIPYIKQNPSAMIPSNNYTVLNEDELKRVYSKYESAFTRFNDFFEQQRTIKNTREFSNYIEMILENNDPT